MQPLIVGVSWLAGHRGRGTQCLWDVYKPQRIPNQHGPPECLILIEVNGNAESIQTGVQCYRCCNVSVSVLPSVRASLLRSSVARAAEEAPHMRFPTLILSREARVPQAKPCPALPLPTTTLGCLLPFLFPMQEASKLAESGENRHSNSNKHHLEALSFMSITCRLPAPNLAAFHSHPKPSRACAEVRPERQAWFKNFMLNSNL